MPIADTIRGFKEIVEGKHDDIPEQAFYMVGTIDEVLERGGEGRASHDPADARPRHRDARPPDRARAEVDEVQLPGANGALGVLPATRRCSPALQPGELWYRNGAEKQFLSIAFGFAEVLPDRVTVLATRRRAARGDRRRGGRSRPRSAAEQEHAPAGVRSRTPSARASR